MIVTCESCNSKFRLDPDKLKKEKNKVRCSRCGHVFMVSRKEAPSRDEEDMDLLGSVDSYEEEGFEEPETEEIRSTPPPFTAANIPLKPGRKGTLRTALLGLVLLVAVGSLVFWFTSDRTPRQAGAPLPGGDTEQALVTILDSTQAYFLQNSPAGQIFVVEGEAINESSRPVSFVLLEGKLYTTRNTVALSQRCYAGNVMSREDLTSLPITEIQNRMMNREGTELSNVHIPPGSRVPFMLVFHNLPELSTLSDYSIEVLSSKIN